MPEKLISRHLTTLNGKKCWLTVVSKGPTPQYHHLDAKHWEAVALCVRRIVLKDLLPSQQNSPRQSMIPRSFDLLEIPTTGSQEPLHYTYQGKSHSLSSQDMDLDTLQKTLRKKPTKPYFTAEEEKQNSQELALFTKEYEQKYPEIRKIHTDIKEDISLETFRFYAGNLQPSSKNLEIVNADTLDPKTLFTQPGFFPLQAHKIERMDENKMPILSKEAHLLGMFIDPHAYQVIVYNPTRHKTKLKDYPALNTVLEELLLQHPHLEIVYQDAGTSKETPQEKRALLRFLSLMLSSQAHTRVASLKKALKEDLITACQNLADKVHSQYHRIYETLVALGASFKPTKAS